MKNDSVEFLPFHAINEFMRPDYRQDIIRRVLNSLSELPDHSRSRLSRLVKQYVKVPGFRSTLQAPAPLLARQTVSSFESKPDLTAALIAAWADLFPDLREKVFSILTSRNWEVLPIDADRTKLPGFFTTWPKDESFDSINQAFTTTYPDDKSSTDDISLMTVWLSVRLPFRTEEESSAS